MREEIKKVLFVGVAEDKELFFQRAQVQGIVHFIDPHERGRTEVPEIVQHITQAIKILRTLPPTEQEENYSFLNADEIVSSILSLQSQHDRLQEELRLLNIEISRIHPFGNFSFADIAYIQDKGHCKIQFFCARPDLFAEEPMPEGLLYCNSEHNLDYYVSISKVPVTYEKMIEMKFDRSLGELKKRRASAQKELSDCHHQLLTFAQYNDYLHHALLEKLNLVHLHNVQGYVEAVMDGALFAVEGWIPANHIDQLPEMIGHLNVYTEEIAIEEGDVVPTFLENEGLPRLGQDLVNIYDTPSSTDKDPSAWVLAGFTLFFAFIINDAGYGLLYLALALFLQYRYPNMKKTAKRFVKLMTVLCLGCIVWGTLMTSFFGMEIGINNPLRKMSLVQWLVEKKVAYHIAHHDVTEQEWVKKYPELKGVTDPHTFVSFTAGPQKKHVVLDRISDNIMFELALFIGVIHLIISFIRYAKRKWYNIGWALFLVGAYLYLPAYLHVPSILNFVGGIDLVQGGVFGFQLMMIGIGLAWVLLIAKYGIAGAFEIMLLIQVFADTLSYLRLYALGLAGAIVASTANEVASSLPLFVAIFVMVIAHAINLLLATMSGVIHGLRLNFLEWYHYSFEGGGKKFSALRLLDRD